MHPLRISIWAVIVLLAGLWLAREYFIAPTDQSRPVVADNLLAVTLPDLDDRPRSLSEWSGRPLIINFWATWCPPCRREIPLLQQLVEQHGNDGPQVIGIALENPTDVRRYVAKMPVSYPMLYGEDQGSAFAERLAEALDDEFVGLPFSAAITSSGEILMVHSGELQAEDLERITAELAAVSAGQRSVKEARARLAIN